MELIFSTEKNGNDTKTTQRIFNNIREGQGGK
jgi:hypothetical protein